MAILYRRAQAGDLQQAGALVVASINDLCRRHGFNPVATVRPPTFSMFCLHDDPDGLWVADEGGEILGFAFSWTCGDLWFLAQLFVSPDHQARGLGRELLRRTLEHAERSDAAIRALITFSFNSVSQGLYMRHGLFPRGPIYNFGIPRSALAREVKGERLGFVPMESTAAHLQLLAKIDASAFGLSRGKHHSFLAADGATRGVLLCAGHECVGYAYLCEGHIGPLAVTHRALLGAAFRTALDLATQSSAPQVSAFIPGASETALRLAVEVGMRITTPMVLMATQEFGNWAQYLPRNPGFM
jgi:GNAT superfamily N-acetyltransferase